MSFEFKKFKINHHIEVFKFGTDAALLATWVNIVNDDSILEIGTGTGVISLMMAQRNPSAKILGIDISKHAVDLAIQNLEHFPLPHKIWFENSSVQKLTVENQFSHIVSNPPFFENSTPSPSQLKNRARHTNELSLNDLLRHSKRLLKPNGTISIIYPIRYLKDILENAKKLNLYPSQIVHTRSTAKKPIRRVLISLKLQECKTQSSELIINGDLHGYSPTVFKMFEPFYLKL
jgi:tRNA1Val (adenine37-N6)-methyltransferase